jgi:hypothetical protein
MAHAQQFNAPGQFTKKEKAAGGRLLAEAQAANLLGRWSIGSWLLATLLGRLFAGLLVVGFSALSRFGRRRISRPAGAGLRNRQTGTEHKSYNQHQ